MKVAFFCRFLTACLLLLGLIGCVNHLSDDTIQRSEAVKARINLALAYLEQKDFPKAKENIDKALAHDPQDYLPYSVLAYYYQQIGEMNNAEKNYQQALNLSQNHSKNHQASPDVLNNYGTFLCKQRQFSQAYQRFEQAMQSEQPYYHQADTLENIVLCANLAQDLPKQTEMLMQLSKLEPDRAIRLQKLLR